MHFLDYDRKVTSQRNTLPSLIYRALVNGYHIENEKKWGEIIYNPMIDMALTPAKIIGSIARGTTFPLDVLVKLLSDRKIK